MKKLLLKLLIVADFLIGVLSVSALLKSRDKLATYNYQFLNLSLMFAELIFLARDLKALSEEVEGVSSS